MRKVIIVLVCCTVLLLLGFSGYRAYQLWNQSKWMSMAKKFATKKDVANESLCLRQVIRLNNDDVDAWRMMADLTESSGSPEALPLRKQVLKLNPGSLDDRLALARTALFARDFNTAADALAGVDDVGKKTSSYLNLAGELAFALGKMDEAKADFAEAIRVDPLSLGPQLSLAIVELTSTNALDVDEARISLERISLNSTNMVVRLEAKRDLIFDALRRKDYDTALSLSKEVVAQPDAIFADKLVHLDILKLIKSDSFTPGLASCEREATTNAQDMAQLTVWMQKQRMAVQALAWLQSLPASLQTNPPAAFLIPQCQMAVHDWNGMQNTLSKQNWGDQEYKRQALLALAMRQQGLDEASKAEWDVAVKSANGREAYLVALCQLALQLNWQDEAQQILWTIVRNFPQEKWAAPQLATMLYASGGTRPLMELFSTEVNRNPDDLGDKNNLAMTSMLLRDQQYNPYDLAREVYQKVPTNSFFACTYAYSLYLQGKNADALKIMEKLTPEELENNTTAGYYGVMLKAAGDNAQAAAYLRRGASSKQLLPEEQAIFQKALSGL